MFCTGEFKKKTVKINVDSWSEYESLKQHGLFNLTGKPLKIVDRSSMLVHNIQSLSKHCKGIMRDKGHKSSFVDVHWNSNCNTVRKQNKRNFGTISHAF